MDIDEKLAELICLQDSITHLNEGSPMPPEEPTILEWQQFQAGHAERLAEIREKIRERNLLHKEIANAFNKEGLPSLPKLKQFVPCSIGECDQWARHVILAGESSEYWPICDSCYDIAQAVCCLADTTLPIVVMPMRDYKTEREHMGITREQEKGGFVISYEEER